MRNLSRPLALSVVAALLLSVGPQAAAKPPPVTKIKFRLDDHQVALGEDVTGSVLVRTRMNKSWEPLADATLSVLVDQVLVGTLTTAADGTALVSYTPAAEGGHAMKLVYAGDATHKRAKRAQGFEVGAELAETELAETEIAETPEA
jgi:hypothetical protein